MAGSALLEARNVATWLCVEGDDLLAFHALTMTSLELGQRQRRLLTASHPRQGAVLIAWLARAAGAEIEGGVIVSHAVGVAQLAARLVGAVAVSADPFDAASESFWVERCAFRRSSTRHRGADGADLRRVYLPLYGAA